MKTTLLIFLGLLLLGNPSVMHAQNLQDFDWQTNADNTITITAYVGSGGAVTLPSTIGNLPVTSIGVQAFYDSTGLTSITIPNSVTSIGALAFEYSGVYNVTFGTGVTNIEDYAFCACPSLTSVIIPDSVAAVGYGAFYECSSLTNVTIGRGVTNIGEAAFESCEKLTAISVSTNNPAYSSSAPGVLYNHAQTTLIQYPIGNLLGSYSILDGVTNIGAAAFSGDVRLTNVMIPPGVNVIESNAFSECQGLMNITIPNGVTSIGYSAFYYCASLSSITIPASVTNIGEFAFAFCFSLDAITVNSNNTAYSSIAGVLFNQSQTLLIQCPAGKAGSITIPASVTSIGGDAFAESSLTSVTIPNSVTNMGAAAFEYSDLSSVTIGNGLTSIGTNLFLYCTGLTNVTILDGVTNIEDDAFGGCFNLASITIPASITSIEGSAFYDCPTLLDVYFEGNAPSVDSTAFTDDDATAYFVAGATGWRATFGGLPTGLWNPPIQCAYIVTNGMITIIGHVGPGGAITIPSTINGLPVTDIGPDAFNSFTSLTSITIPSSVTNIGAGAFEFTGLTNVTIPFGVTSIESNAFESCASLSSITIPDSVTSIGDYAFNNCPSLTNVMIGNSVIDIGNFAFAATSLTGVTIPASVTTIGEYAFAGYYTGNSSLTGLYFAGNAPSADSTVFLNDNNTTVYYLAGTAGWSTSFGGVQTRERAGLLVATDSLPSGTNGVGFSQQLNASGGLPPYTWTLTSGRLPAALTLETNGLISGRPTTNGTFDFTVKVSDATNGTATQSLSLTITTGGLQVTTLWLFGGTTTVAYSQTLTASGGQPPYTWTNILGTLPPGLSLANDGMISGTPTLAGTASFTLKVTDGTNATATQALLLNVSAFAPLQIKTVSLPNGTNGLAYSQQLSALYGQPPYRWSLVSGSLPSGLTLTADGLLAGTPAFGGPANFTVSVSDELYTTDTETLTLRVIAKVLHTFSGSPSDGANPIAGLLLSGNRLYGTTSEGGSGGAGTVFAVNTDGTGFTNLYNFTAVNNYINGDGANPYAGVILSGNTLYGTTQVGGNPGYGTVFAVNTDGTGFRNLHNFDFYDGFTPQGTLLLSGNTLYGTTVGGGTALKGTVFKVNTDSTGFMTLYSFTAGTAGPYGFVTNSDGAEPWDGLILSGATLYGTTFIGGTLGCGTVFSLNTNGTGFTNLHNFTNGSDGAEPQAALILLGNTLYGTTSLKGTDLESTVFEVNTNGTGFTPFIDSDVGGYPSGLALSDNTLYWTGSRAEGLFSMNTNGTDFTNVYSFTPYNFDEYDRLTNSDGSNPEGNLVIASSTLYGTAEQGGYLGEGTVFNLYLAPSIQDSASPTNGLVPLAVQFAAAGADSGGNPITSWIWNFGDGSTSTAQNPSHVYASAATFTPSLVATNNLGVAVYGSGPTITAFLPTVRFTANPTLGLIPQTVQFESPGVDSGGSPITSWNWNFDDGSESTNQNPSHVYTSSGTFLPSLVATNNVGVRVNGSGPAITASVRTIQYSANPAFGLVPLKVQFVSPDVDAAGNAITNWNWSFGDGSTSTAENPTHLFTNASTFSPTLIAINNNGVQIFGSGPSISVSPPPAVLTVGFTANPTIGAAPLAVSFTSAAVDSASNIIISWNWSFGDGSTSTTQNPFHIYTTPGTFYPTLTANNNIGGTVPGSGPASITATGAPLYSGLVLNGGFETGDFTGWTLSGPNTNDMIIDDGSISGINPHSGSYSAALGSANALSYISQTLATTPGATYFLSFWLNSPDGLTPNEFLVSWNGNTLFDKMNLPEITGWTNLQFELAATGNNTVLQFGGRDDPSYLGLDDVSVVPSGPTIPVTANPTNGLVPLTVSFTSAGVDSAGNILSRWNWTFGDGSTSTVQNPSHTYTTVGTFSPSLTATNNLGVAVYGAGPSVTANAAPVSSGLVLNGGFETGDFTGWTLSGPDTNEIIIDDGLISGIDPHSGSFFAALGSTNSASYLSQTLVTTSGSAYLLSFWLNSPDGLTPNEFLVSWNGNTLFDKMNLPEITGWTNLQFAVVATGASTVLRFGGRDDPSFLGLDDISVLPAQAQLGIGSLSLSGTNLVLDGLNGQSGVTYYVLMTTNLTLPLSQWTPVATNVLGANGNFRLVVTNTVTPTAPQRYYILESP